MSKGRVCLSHEIESHTVFIRSIIKSLRYLRPFTILARSTVGQRQHRALKSKDLEFLQVFCVYVRNEIPATLCVAGISVPRDHACV